MRSKTFFLGVVLAIAPLALAACGSDGGGGGLDCGEGTTEVDGACVPDFDRIECATGTVQVGLECVPENDLCDAGQAWVGGECVDIIDCAAGTVPGPDGNCIPADDLCEGDQVWVGGECVDPGCGAGTANIDGECIPVEDLCDAGQIWAGGECRPERGCGPGTIELNDSGECVPIPDPTPDVAEAPENNDMGLGGTPATFTLPATLDETILLGGVLDPPTDWDDDGVLDEDFDSFVFDGTAGQRLNIEGTALDAPAVGFIVNHRTGSGSIDFQRLAVPLRGRNSAREVVLPFTGQYEISVGYLAYIPGGGPVVVPDGGDSFTYLVAVTPIANPTPTEESSGNFTVSGDAAELPQFLVTAPAGSVLNVSVRMDNLDVAGLYWGASNDYAEFFGEFLSGLHPVPPGGLLLTVDYAYAGAEDTGYTIDAERIDPTTIIPGNDYDETLSAGGTAFYGFVLNDAAVVRVGMDPGEDTGSDMAMGLLSSELDLIAVAGEGDSTEQSATVALDAGTYFVEVLDFNLPDEPAGPFPFALSIDSWPLIAIGDPVDETTNSILLDAIDDLAAADDSAYFYFDVGEVGDVTLTATPQTDLDVALELYDSKILAIGDVFDPAAEIDDEVEGTPEAGSWLLPPDRVIVRAAAAAVNDVETPATLFSLGVEFVKTEDTYIQEVEPNNTPDTTSSVGELGQGTIYGYGHFRDIDPITGYTDDFYQFTLATPANVVVDQTQPMGLGDVPTTLFFVLDGDLNTLFVNSDGFSIFDPMTDIDLAPGAYYIYTYEYLDNPEGWYRIEFTPSFYDVCLPGTPTCTGESGELLGTCNDTGDGVEAETILCAGGCDSARGACDISLTEDESVTRNDTSATATDITPGDTGLVEGVTVVAGTIEDLGATRDHDWYTFELDGISEVTISTGPRTDETFDTEIWLYDSDGNLLANDDDGSPIGLYSQIGPTFLRPGDYYVRVAYTLFYGPDDVGDPPSDYVLNILVEGRACFPFEGTCEGNVSHQCNANGTAVDLDVTCGISCVTATGMCESAVDTEPNDTAETAQPLPAADTEIAMGHTPADAGISPVGDHDWYSFNFTGDDRVVTLGTLPVGGNSLDTVITLYEVTTPDPLAYDEIDSDDDGGPGLFSLLGPMLLPAGDYLIEVEELGDNNTGDYQLFVDMQAPECDPGDQTCGDATSLSVCVAGLYTDLQCLDACGGTAPDAVCSALTAEVMKSDSLATGEIDYYGFTVDASQDLSLEVSPASGMDSQLWICEDVPCLRADALYDALSDGDDGFGGELDTLDVTLSPGVYYVGVGRWSGTGNYDLTVSVPFCGNGITEGGETCDDADDTNPDGCSACQIDIAWDCDTTMEPSVCTYVATDLGDLDSSTPISQEATLADNADQHWYTFNLLEDAVVTFETSIGTDGNADLDTLVTIFDLDGNVVDEDDDLDLLTLFSSGLDAGEYYLLVEVSPFADAFGYDGSGPYVLDISAEVTLCTPDAVACDLDGNLGVCNADGSALDTTVCTTACGTFLNGVDCGYIAEVPAETLALDSRQHLGTLAPGTTAVEGVITDADPDLDDPDGDFYAFTLDDASEVTIETMPPVDSALGGLTDTELYLYADGETSLANDLAYDDDRPVDAFSLIETRTLDAGTYVVRVDDYGSTFNSGPYRLEIRVAAIVPPPPTVYSETFDTWPPTDWTIEDGASTDATWEQCDGCGITLNNSDGPFAIIDSDAPGSGTTVDSTLVSRSFDLTGYTGAQLILTHYFRAGFSGVDSGTVELSIDGGSSWSTVETYTSSTTNGADAILDIGAADGQADVMVRFHYVAGWDYYWLIDNLRIAANN